MTTKTATLELTDKFIKGLANYDLTLCDIENGNWRYCGGRTGSHLNYFRLCCPEDDLPPHAIECVCGHPIEENCYITNGEEILILGNSCIKKFIPKSSRTCEECGCPHQNRKDNKCNDCRPKKKKGSKTCERCGSLHRNRIVNRCNNCRKGICDKCDKKCSEQYDTCYNCKYR